MVIKDTDPKPEGMRQAVGPPNIARTAQFSPRNGCSKSCPLSPCYQDQLRWKACSPSHDGAWRPLIQTTRKKRTSTGDTSLPPDHLLMSVYFDTMPGPYVAANVPLYSASTGVPPTLIPWFREPSSSCTHVYQQPADLNS